MQFDMEQLSADNRYKLLTATVTPRPIAWVTSKSVDGIVNAAPFSFFNVMGHEPPTVTLGLLRRAGGGYKDTAENIMATGEFVINLVSESMADSMNETCTDAPPGIDELELAGLTAIPSVAVAPPRIAGCPVSFECRSLSSIVTGPCQVIVVATVLRVHIEDEFLIDAERCHVDTPALKLVSRMHGSGWYARSTDLFQLARPRYKAT